MHALFKRTEHVHEFIYTCTSIAKKIYHSNMWKLENIYLRLIDLSILQL